MKGALAKQPDSGSKEAVLKGVVQEFEEKTIRRALDLCKGKKLRAARMLGISRSVLYSKMRRYGISS